MKTGNWGKLSTSFVIDRLRYSEQCFQRGTLQTPPVGWVGGRSGWVYKLPSSIMTYLQADQSNFPGMLPAGEPLRKHCYHSGESVEEGEVNWCHWWSCSRTAETDVDLFWRQAWPGVAWTSIHRSASISISLRESGHMRLMLRRCWVLSFVLLRLLQILKITLYTYGQNQASLAQPATLLACSQPDKINVSENVNQKHEIFAWKDIERAVHFAGANIFRKWISK